MVLKKSIQSWKALWLPWDRRLFYRTSVLQGLLTALLLMVAVATDEAQSTWTDRLVRLAALSPALGAVAVALLRQQGSQRGEWRAWELMRQHPLRAAWGALLAAAGSSAFLAIAVLGTASSLRSLFPRLPPVPWQRTPAEFVAPTLGMAWDGHSDNVRFFTPIATDSTGTQARLWAIVVTSALACLLPFWAALRCHGLQRIAVGVATVMIAIGCFHRTAMGYSGAWLLAPVLLLAMHVRYLWTLENKIHRARM
jgi:hypothetical protein